MRYAGANTSTKIKPIYLLSQALPSLRASLPVASQEQFQLMDDVL